MASWYESLLGDANDPLTFLGRLQEFYSYPLNQVAVSVLTGFLFSTLTGRYVRTDWLVYGLIAYEAAYYIYVRGDPRRWDLLTRASVNLGYILGFILARELVWGTVF
jgi:hypothetical protein